jgi:hypothetical protein
MAEPYPRDNRPDDLDPEPRPPGTTQLGLVEPSIETAEGASKGAPATRRRRYRSQEGGRP